jgi:GDP-4-dehydro-6-deoxy-D-mannose reductase
VPRRILITGITGFAGSHLAEHALACGEEVHGFAFEGPPYPNLAQAQDVRMHRGDVSDVEAVRAVVADARPDVVVHLAGQAVPALASQDPTAAVRVNVLGTAAVVDALRASRARLVFASTAEVYGVPDGPAREDAPIRPPNVYAATKVAAEALARELGDRAIVLRPVSQVGPRQHPALAASAFARQIARAEAGLEEPLIRHGRLDSRRDVIDVRDMARAYRLAADLPGPATFNVGSGRTVAMQELFDALVSLSRVPLRTQLDPERLRAGDPAAVDVDATAFRERTGWAPAIALDRSLRDLLDHWRSQVRGEVPAGA